MKRDGEEVKMDYLFKQPGHPGIGYLASPYSSKSKALMQRRFEAITDLAAKLFESGMILFCPITQSVAIVKKSKKLTGLWSTWQTVDLSFVDKLDYILVVKFPGWDKSVGLQAELDYAITHKKRIMTLEENDPIILHLVEKYSLNDEI